MLPLTADKQIMLLNSQLTASEQLLLLMVCKAAALFWRVALPLILIRKVDRVGRAQCAVELFGVRARNSSCKLILIKYKIINK